MTHRLTPGNQIYWSEADQTLRFQAFVEGSTKKAKALTEKKIIKLLDSTISVADPNSAEVSGIALKLFESPHRLYREKALLLEPLLSTYEVPVVKQLQEIISGIEFLDSPQKK